MEQSALNILTCTGVFPSIVSLYFSVEKVSVEVMQLSKNNVFLLL